MLALSETMHRVGIWMQRGRLNPSASNQSLDSLAESQNLEIALKAAELVLNDDIEGAERSLENGNSSFHKLARGVIYFLQAAMGFEQEMMHRALVQLADAESTALNDESRAWHNSGAFHSDIYDKGSEFALCHAQAQIMSAVIGVMSESLTESIKGFYKLRKAYGTLSRLLEMEDRFMKTRGFSSLEKSRRPWEESLQSTESAGSGNGKTNSPNTESVEDPHTAKHPSALRDSDVVYDRNCDPEDSDHSDEFCDVDEYHAGQEITKAYTGKLEFSTYISPPTEKFAKTSPEEHSAVTEDISGTPSLEVKKGTKSNDLTLLDHGPDSNIFSNPLDIFVHSGASFCFGQLLLLISTIPPAFVKLLAVAGFRRDRDRGIKLLWQASKFENINGGMAGIILLAWYNSIAGLCDIVPDPDPANPDDFEGYPIARLDRLLAVMRKRYPDSQFWLLEEARMAAAHQRPGDALKMLSAPSKSHLAQLRGLHTFEKGLNAMYAHEYALCSEAFITCLALNNWSQSLYHYIAGAAHLSLYRDLKNFPGKKMEAAEQGRLAEKNFRSTPTYIGKKKIMGRQLPFDIFVGRKLVKWEQRAKEWGCELIDAAGVSPLEEMAYLWNGYKKMDADNLNKSLRNLEWSESDPRWSKEEVDEKAILALLRAAILRNQRRHSEAKKVLQEGILCHDPALFKGQHRDDWVPPTAHYEMAVNLWMERREFVAQDGGPATPSKGADLAIAAEDRTSDTELVLECRKYIEKTKNWERYVLDARQGIKVTAAADAITKWAAKHSPLVANR